MPCIPFSQDGVRGFVCTTRDQKRCACGNRATRLCDWKVRGKTSGTCDKPLCAKCTHVPKAGKDLCPKHAAQWKARSA